MKLNLVDANKSIIFSNILKQLKSFTNDVNINFYKDKFYIQFLDTNHICLCELVLMKEWFNNYVVKDETHLGINTNILQKIIKCKGENDAIEIEYNTDADRMNMSFNNYDDKNIITKAFEVPLVEMDIDMLNIPENTESQADIKIQSSLFFHLINELALFSNNLNMEVNENEIYMNADGDSGKYSINVDIEKIEEFSIDEGANIKTTYSIKYFTLISNFSKISKYVNLSIGENTPIIITFNLDNCGVNDNDSLLNGTVIEDDDSEPENYIRFFLAPLHDD